MSEFTGHAHTGLTLEVLLAEVNGFADFDVTTVGFKVEEALFTVDALLGVSVAAETVLLVGAGSEGGDSQNYG